MKWVGDFLSKLRWNFWVKKLPYPLRVAIVLAVGYFTLLGDTTDALRLIFDVPESTIRILRWTYATLALVSFLLLTAVTVPIAKLQRARQVLTWPVRLIVAAVIAAGVGIGLTIERGVQTSINDSQRLNQVQGCLKDLEKQLKASVLSEAGEVRNDLENVMRIARAIGDSSGASADHSILATLRKDSRYTVENAFRRIIVLGAWDASGNRLAFVDVAPRSGDTEAPDYARQLLSAPIISRQNAASWLSHTSIGLVAAVSLPGDDGVWVAGSPWTERNFLQATSPYWRDRQWGISLVGDNQRVLYSSEISEFGEPLNGLPAPNIGEQQLTEVRFGEGVQYLYQQTIDSEVLGHITVLLRLPPEVEGSWLDYLKIAVSLLILLLSAAAFLAEETQDPNSPGGGQVADAPA